MVADLTQRLPIRVAFVDSTIDHHINDMVAESPYHIAQEAVCNAIRHGQCSLVTVALCMGEVELTLDITDDGCGFDAVSLRREPLGLRMMEYRARIVGGTMQFEQRAAGGIRIVVSAPLSDARVIER